MSAVSSPKQAAELARSNEWQVAPSAGSFGAPRLRTRSRRMRALRGLAWNLLPPLTFVAMVGLWWGAVELFKIPAYLLPGPGSVFWNVTLPAIAPVATFVVVTSTIGSFQLFELPYALLQQFNSNRGFGPKNSGMTVVGYLYQRAFEDGDLGMAAAVGWVLTAIILLISLVQIRISSRVAREGP